MANKLDENGRWATKMMLTEHVRALDERRERTNLRQRVSLDEQELEEVSRALSDSCSQQMPVKVLMFDEYEQLEVIGIVDRLDQQKRRFMVDGEWFKFEDIEGASREGFESAAVE